MKRILSVILCVTFILLTLAACGGKQEGTAAPETADPVTLNVAAMTGPTGMGLAQLMDTFGVDYPEPEKV